MMAPFRRWRVRGGPVRLQTVSLDSRTIRWRSPGGRSRRQHEPRLPRSRS